MRTRHNTIGTVKYYQERPGTARTYLPSWRGRSLQLKRFGHLRLFWKRHSALGPAKIHLRVGSIFGPWLPPPSSQNRPARRAAPDVAHTTEQLARPASVPPFPPASGEGGCSGEEGAGKRWVDGPTPGPLLGGKPPPDSTAILTKTGGADVKAHRTENGARTNVPEHSRMKRRTRETIHSTGHRRGTRAGTREGAHRGGRCTRMGSRLHKARTRERGTRAPRRGTVTQRGATTRARGAHAVAKNASDTKKPGVDPKARARTPGPRDPSPVRGVTLQTRVRGRQGMRPQTGYSHPHRDAPRGPRSLKGPVRQKGHTHWDRPRRPHPPAPRPTQTHRGHHSKRRGATRTHPHSPHTHGGGVEGPSPRASRLQRDKVTHPGAPPRARWALTGARSPRASDAGRRRRRRLGPSTSASGRARAGGGAGGKARHVGCAHAQSCSPAPFRGGERSDPAVPGARAL